MYNIIIVDGSYAARSRYETGQLPDGFFNYLDRIREKYPHDAFWIAWDHPNGSALRKKIYPGYKAGRVHPEEYKKELRKLKMLIFSCGIPQVESPDGEADDVMYTIECQNKGRTLVVTCDKDLLQMVSQKCDVLRTYKGEDILVTVNNFESIFGLSPESWKDYLILVGDSADRIKGAPGLGAVTAKRLLKKYKTIAGFTEEAALATDPSMVKNAMMLKTQQALEQINLARELITLRKCTLKFTLKDEVF
jgi:DNA polymerase-1